MPVKLIRDLVFRGTLISLVGAVVMMAGADSKLAKRRFSVKGWLESIRRGTGGGCSACCFAFKESCESEAFRNRKTENRLCLLVSSCTGGVSGRLAFDSSSTRCAGASSSSEPVVLFGGSCAEAEGSSWDASESANMVRRRISASLV